MAYLLKNDREELVYLKGKPVTCQDCVTCGMSELKDFSDKDRTLLHVVSRATPDRVGDVVEIDGWQLDDFRRNPVVQPYHNYKTLPVGRSLKIYPEGDKLFSITQFHDREESRLMYSMYRDNYLKGWSVGFVSLKSEPIKDDEKKRKGLLDGPTRFLKQSLLEYSVCPIPCHADALAEVQSLVKQKRLAIPQKYLVLDNSWECRGGLCRKKGEQVRHISLPTLQKSAFAKTLDRVLDKATEPRIRVVDDTRKPKDISTTSGVNSRGEKTFRISKEEMRETARETVEEALKEELDRILVRLPD